MSFPRTPGRLGHSLPGPWTRRPRPFFRASAGLFLLALLDPADEGSEDALAAAGDALVGEAGDGDAGDLELGHRVGLLGAALLLAKADQPATRRGLEAAVAGAGEEDQQLESAVEADRAALGHFAGRLRRALHVAPADRRVESPQGFRMRDHERMFASISSRFRRA